MFRWYTRGIETASNDTEIAAFVHRGEPTTPRGQGPLGGLEVGVKDLYRVDGMPTRGGSSLPARLFDGPESVVVGALRRAGATIVGKAAMDEFAYCEPPTTKNPRDLRRTPGGSSGGSAAAVAAGMCPLALGSQTLKSVIVPASFCGVVGFVPTYGRITFDGLPLSPAFDTVGFLAADVGVLQTVLPHVVPDWRTGSRPTRLVLGVPERWGSAKHDDGWEAFDRHVEQLRDAGYELRRGRLPWHDDIARWATSIGDLLHGEMARAHAGWFADNARG